MTVTDRIHAQSFCYDADLPPSVPEGMSLRGSRSGKAKEQRLRRGLRRLVPGARAAARRAA